MHFKRIQFKNFKAFKSFSVILNEFNVLVGPNNAGKSTVISAFRLLSEGLKKANKRKPSYLKYNNKDKLGYRIELEGLPIATENIFHNYNDRDPASITFTLTNNNKLILHFPEVNSCNLFVESETMEINSPSKFRHVFKDLSVGFVPVLGPVAKNEGLYQKEAARLALQSYTASRNFRNIWYHYPDGFDKFRELVRKTWPTMDIEKPKIEIGNNGAELIMFCPEERIPREIFWAGFGFQVWCQMLTFILKSANDTVLLIDEPDIYLHSDLQKQLVAILKELGTDVIIATHSTEIITEVEPEEVMTINKDLQSARRIKNITQLNPIFSSLGSNLNPILTQISKNRKVLFLEGKDFKIIGQIARKFDKIKVANQSDFAIIQSEGFNPSKVENIVKGIEIAIGSNLDCGVIFDSDYRCQDEKNEIITELNNFTKFAAIHDRKELENFLLIPHAIEKAIEERIQNYNKRSNSNIEFTENFFSIFEKVTKPIKHHVVSQYLENAKPYIKKRDKGIHDSTITSKLLKEYDDKWDSLEDRIMIVPGKQVLAKINEYLQENYKVCLTSSQIVRNAEKNDFPKSIIGIIEELERFERAAAG